MDLWIYNVGYAPLVLGSTSNNLPEFTFSPDPEDSTIAPDDSMMIRVTFAPTDELDYVDTLTVENNDETVFVRLTGRTPEIFEVTPNPLDFGFEDLGAWLMLMQVAAVLR